MLTELQNRFTFDTLYVCKFVYVFRFNLSNHYANVITLFSLCIDTCNETQLTWFKRLISRSFIMGTRRTWFLQLDIDVRLGIHFGLVFAIELYSDILEVFMLVVAMAWLEQPPKTKAASWIVYSIDPSLKGVNKREIFRFFMSKKNTHTPAT